MKRNSTYELLRDKTGAALLTVLTVFLVLVVLIVSATMVAQANFLRAKTSSDHASAYYIAESGLNEHFESFEKYFADNNDKLGNIDIFFDAFLDKLGASEDGVLRYEYDKVMNQVAFADVNTKYTRVNDKEYDLVFTSKGYLGDETRLVSINITIDVETLSFEYNPDSFLVLDFTSNPISPLVLPINGSKMTGPMITNKPIVTMTEVIYSGALITNNKIVFDKHKINFENGVIISSGELIFKYSTTGPIRAVVIKEGGSINLSTPDVAMNFSYLLLPMDAQKNPGRYIKTSSGKTVVPSDLSNLSTKVFYYNPINFDPFDIAEYTPHKAGGYAGFKPEVIFGPRPDKDADIDGIHYEQYFASDFVLDNTDNPEIVNNYLPMVKLPERPVYRDRHINGELYKIETYPNSTSVLVDGNNNLKTNGDFWNGDNRIVLGANANEDTGSSTSIRHYNTFEIIGSPDQSKPLTIDVGDRHVTIVTKSLKWDGNVRIVGKGSLKIFVIGRNNILEASDIQINFTSVTLRDTPTSENNHNSTKFQVFAYETKTPVTITTQTGNNFEFNGIIFSENLNIISSLNYYGSFVSAKGKDIKFFDAGNGIKADLIFAPESTIKLGGKVFEGVAVGKDYSYSENDINIKLDSDFDPSFTDILEGIISIGGGGSSNSTKGVLTKQPIREVSP